MNPAAPAKKRVAILGGAFDPPHNGHLRLAQLAWENLALDELRFLPAFAAPLKPEPAASPEDRLEMLWQMLAETPYSIEKTEFARQGTSYTADTLELLCQREPNATWILTMGSDQAEGFANWRSAELILKLASVAVAIRPNGRGKPTITLPSILKMRLSDTWSGNPGEAVLLPSTDLELSSSMIRGQLAKGQKPLGVSLQVSNAIAGKKIYL